MCVCVCVCVRAVQRIVAGWCKAKKSKKFPKPHALCNKVTAVCKREAELLVQYHSVLPFLDESITKNRKQRVWSHLVSWPVKWLITISWHNCPLFIGSRSSLSADLDYSNLFLYPHKSLSSSITRCFFAFLVSVGREVTRGCGGSPQGLQLNIGKKKERERWRVIENGCKLFCRAVMAWGSLLLIHKDSIHVYILTIHHTGTVLSQTRVKSLLMFLFPVFFLFCSNILCIQTSRNTYCRYSNEFERELDIWHCCSNLLLS